MAEPFTFVPNLKTREFWLICFLLVVEVVLMFVWSVPGTIALRNCLLVLLMIGLFCGKMVRTPIMASLASFGVLLLIMLSVWVLVQNLTIAWDPKRSWYESVQWYKSMVCGGLGIWLACIGGREGTALAWRPWIIGMAGVWAAHLVLNFLLKDWSAPLHDVLQADSLIGSRDLESYLGTHLLAIVLADVAGRLTGRARLIPCSTTWVVLGMVLTVALTGAMLTRNALPVMGLEVLLAIAGVLVVSRPGKERLRRVGMASGALLLIVCVFAVDLALDPRWKNLSETAVVAWDIDAHQWWLDPDHNPYPQTIEGKPVDDSAYSRVAWMHGILRMIGDYPLGTGYDRNAFRRALARHYGPAQEVSPGHAHTGVMDFTLATGIPGGVMLVAALLVLAVEGWRRWRHSESVAGLALTLFVSGYLLRAFMDGIVRDHMLEQAMFVMGLLLASSLRDSSERSA